MHAYAHTASTIVVVHERETYTFHTIEIAGKDGRGSDTIFVDRRSPGNRQYVFPLFQVRTYDQLLEVMANATDNHRQAVWQALEGLTR